MPSFSSGWFLMLQGFVVLAVEHADGTASTVQLAGKQGTRFYGGWLSEEERLAQTRCPCITLPFSYRPLAGDLRNAVPCVLNKSSMHVMGFLAARQHMRQLQRFHYCNNLMIHPPQ